VGEAAGLPSEESSLHHPGFDMRVALAALSAAMQPLQPITCSLAHRLDPQLHESLSSSQGRLQALMSKQGRASQFNSQDERDAFLKVGRGMRVGERLDHKQALACSV
jgi:hypothetical protein